MLRFETLREAPQLSNLSLDLSHISAVDKEVREVSVNLRRLSEEDTRLLLGTSGLQAGEASTSQGEEGEVSRRSARLSRSSVNYCEDTEDTRRPPASSRSRDTTQTSAEEEDIVIMDTSSSTSQDNTSTSRRSSSVSSLSSARRRSSVASASGGRAECGECGESIARAELAHHRRTLHGPSRRPRTSLPAARAERSIPNLGSLYRTKPMESRRSILSKTCPSLARSAARTPRSSRTPAPVLDKAERSRMLRSLEGGSGPVVTSGESGNEYQYCEAATSAAEAGSARDTAAASLESGAGDEASLDPGSAEGLDTAASEDGDLGQAEPRVDTRDGDADQEAAVTELVEDSVQEAKFPHPPPSPPPADTPAPSVSSFIVTIGVRKMCKICGMQVSENIFVVQC